MFITLNKVLAGNIVYGISVFLFFKDYFIQLFN